MQPHLSFFIGLFWTFSYSGLFAQATPSYLKIERVYDLSQVKPTTLGEGNQKIEFYIPPRVQQTEFYQYSDEALYEVYAHSNNVQAAIYRIYRVQQGKLQRYQSHSAWASKLKPDDYPYTKEECPKVEAKFKGKALQKIGDYPCRKAEFSYQDKNYEACLSEDFPLSIALPHFWVEVQGKPYALLAWQELGTANSAKLSAILPRLVDYDKPAIKPSFSPELELPFDRKSGTPFKPEAGKVHVLYYIGLFCEACFEDLPELLKLQAEFPQVRFGLANPNLASTWEALLQHLQLALPLWTSPWPQGFGDISPSAAIYDEQGQLIYQTRPGTQAALVLPTLFEALEKHLGS